MSSPPKKFIILETVDSTNNYAMGLVQNDLAESGDAVFAMEQTAGKGRRGKNWESNKGQNVVLTVISDMKWLPVFSQFQLSVAVSMACHDFFTAYTKTEIKIKWPNDIFMNDRKAGGILIENVLQGNLWQWAIIGIGLNINQEEFESSNSNAISLKQMTHKSYDAVSVSKELHENVLDKIASLKNGGYSKMLSAYNSNLFAKNKKVKLRKGNITFETTIERVSSNGELVTKDAIERTFGFDAIEWIW
ncbi:MAG: biotin--[acetyl-CoA-carboxylase] ligase [Ginsengibacter sp.]